ncbi:hypothetical protein E2320_014350, partial [Naja naja]
MEENPFLGWSKEEDPEEVREALGGLQKVVALKPQADEEGGGPQLGSVPSGFIGHHPQRTSHWGKEEAREGVTRCWETQLQVFLKKMESPGSSWRSAPLAEEPAPWDNAKAFLDSFEDVAKACRWPREEWVARLLPALHGKPQQVFDRMVAKDRMDYGKVSLKESSVHSSETGQAPPETEQRQLYAETKQEDETNPIEVLKENLQKQGGSNRSEGIPLEKRNDVAISCQEGDV